MRLPPPRFPHRRATPHPWRPMTDAEWSRLHPVLVAKRRTGRPPADLRRTWDAVFWIACSRLPWRRLPPELGKPDTAHRALRRAARTGLLGSLMLEVSDHPQVGGWEALRWRVCRACRRAAKVMSLAHTLMAERLGLRDALPCAPHALPQPRLSETILFHARFLRFPSLQPTLFPLLRRLHRLLRGDWGAWKLTE